MREPRPQQDWCVNFVVVFLFCAIILALQGCGSAGAKGPTTTTNTNTSTTTTTTTNNPAISNASLPGGSVGVVYSTTLGASGGTAPYTWSVSAGSLPGGLTLATTTGQISGTPTTSGSFNVTFKVTDNAGGTASKSLTMAIAASASLAVATNSVPTATTGTTYSVNLAATGGVSPDTWSVTSGTLPSGVTLAANGQLSGTASATGSFSFTATVTDSASHTASQALVLIVVAPLTPGSTDGPATLPSAFINTKFPNQPNATVYNVTSSSATDLQTKINTAAANCGANGAVVSVPAGATYTAANYFNLPATTCTGGARVVIESANLASLPPQGTRVSASNTNMPTITNAQASTSYPVLIAADNPTNPPAHYWLSGLEVTSNYPSSGGAELALLVFGDYCNQIGGGGCPIAAGMTAANLANDFTVDRCWIHGSNVTSDVLHGIRFTASNFAVEDSIISDIHDSYSNPGQSTGISSDFTMGPVDIGNTEIAAVTENIIFGGTDPTIPNSVPSDIYIHHNYIHKPTAWLTANGGTYQNYMRNFVECKNCQRMLVEGNTFDTVVGNSLSASLQMTPRNANGKCTWCVVQDVTVRYNHFSNIADWISFLGANGNTSGGSLGPELPFKRGSIHDNVVENLNDSVYGANGRWIQINDGDASSTGCSATANSASCQLSDLTITHNSLVSGQATNATNTFWTLAGTPAAGSRGYNVAIINNIVPAGANGFGSDTGSAHPLTGFLNAQFSSYTFNNNVITGVAAVGYSCTDFPSPIQNFCGTIGQPAAMASVLFANYNNGIGGDYHLQATSPYKNQATDGSDPGANVDLAAAFTSGSVSGTSSSSSSSSLTILTATLPDVAQNTPYSATLVATGGTKPYSWSVTSGTLPLGLTLNSATGTISGTSNVLGTVTLGMQVTDAASATATLTLNLILEVPPPVLPTSLVVGTNPNGTTYTVAFPGYVAWLLGSGDNPTISTTSYHGLIGYWDLKNDPTMQYDFGAGDVGIMEYQWNSTNADGTLHAGPGAYEFKESPGTVTILEQNNERVRLEWDYVPRFFGKASGTADPDLTVKEFFTFYRPGKIYHTIKFSNSNADGKGPLSLGTLKASDTGDPPVFDLIPKITWEKVSNQNNEIFDEGNSCDGGYSPVTPSPWSYVYQGTDGDDLPNKTWILYTAKGSSIYPSGSTCSGPKTPQDIAVCANNHCSPYPPAIASHVAISADLLRVAGENTGPYLAGGALAGGTAYFLGLRTRIFFEGECNQCLTTGQDVLVRHSLAVGGDNGITDKATADAYASEYRSAPSPTTNAGSYQSFNQQNGDYQLTASSNAVDFNATGQMFEPALTISNWTNPLPATIRLNGSVLNLNTDYVGVVASGTLELQILRNLTAGDHVQVP